MALEHFVPDPTDEAFPWIRGLACALLFLTGAAILLTHIDSRAPSETVFQGIEAEVVLERNSVYQIGGLLLMAASMALFTILEIRATIAAAMRAQLRAYRNERIGEARLAESRAAAEREASWSKIGLPTREPSLAADLEAERQQSIPAPPLPATLNPMPPRR